MAAAKPWADLTPDEKRAKRIDAWRNPAVEFNRPEAEADYKARIDRLIAAIPLEKPDRVPINLNTGFWPATSAGMTPYEAMNDPVKARSVRGMLTSMQATLPMACLTTARSAWSKSHTVLPLGRSMMASRRDP